MRALFMQLLLHAHIIGSLNNLADIDEATREISPALDTLAYANVLSKARGPLGTWYCYFGVARVTIADRFSPRIPRCLEA